MPAWKYDSSNNLWCRICRYRELALERVIYLIFCSPWSSKGSIRGQILSYMLGLQKKTIISILCWFICYNEGEKTKIWFRHILYPKCYYTDMEWIQEWATWHSALLGTLLPRDPVQKHHIVMSLAVLYQGIQITGKEELIQFSTVTASSDTWLKKWFQEKKCCADIE